MMILTSHYFSFNQFHDWIPPGICFCVFCHLLNIYPLLIFVSFIPKDLIFRSKLNKGSFLCEISLVDFLSYCFFLGSLVGVIILFLFKLYIFKPIKIYVFLDTQKFQAKPLVMWRFQANPTKSSSPTMERGEIW